MTDRQHAPRVYSTTLHEEIRPVNRLTRTLVKSDYSNSESSVLSLFEQPLYVLQVVIRYYKLLAMFPLKVTEKFIR